MQSVVTCVVTGCVAGDEDACGDCYPCIEGADGVPNAVRRLIAEKALLRDRYAEAADEVERLRALCISICSEAGFDPANWPINN